MDANEIKRRARKKGTREGFVEFYEFLVDRVGRLIRSERSRTKQRPRTICKNATEERGQKGELK